MLRALSQRGSSAAGCRAGYTLTGQQQTFTFIILLLFFFFNRDFREPPLSIKDNRQNGKLADEIRLQQVAVELLKQPAKLLSGRFSGSPTCEVLRKVQC